MRDSRVFTEWQEMFLIGIDDNKGRVPGEWYDSNDPQIKDLRDDRLVDTWRALGGSEGFLYILTPDGKKYAEALAA